MPSQVVFPIILNNFFSFFFLFPFFFFFFFCFFFFSWWFFVRGWNPRHSRNQSPCSDNTGFLNCDAIRELQQWLFQTFSIFLNSKPTIALHTLSTWHGLTILREKIHYLEFQKSRFTNFIQLQPCFSSFAYITMADGYQHDIWQTRTSISSTSNLTILNFHYFL